MGAGVVGTEPSPLWYLTRGTGLVALILLTGAVALGVMNIGAWHRPGWPRFATARLHRNLSLLVVVLLAIHIVTAELDTFAPVGWLAVALPFASAYRPVWLGLGTLAFDLIVALTVTSLLRARLGHRTWRAVHWAAYAAWPLGLLHGLGTGTDARIGWVQILDVICLVVVLAALGWRLVHGWPSRAPLRVSTAIASSLVMVVMGAWAYTGPLQAGWARRSGTPSSLLATAQTVAPTISPPPATVTPKARGPVGISAVPALPFVATLSGVVNQTAPDASRHLVITIGTRVSGPMMGALTIVLRGLAAGSGVSLESSSVSFGPEAHPGQYQGDVVLLNGDQLVASVRSGAGPAIDLGVLLKIDPVTGSVRGSIDAHAALLPASSLDGNDQDGDS